MRAKNRPLIVAAACIGLTVVLFFGMRIALMNFIEFPIGLFVLAMIASLITGIVFSVKALKREKSPRTYAAAAVGVLILAGLIFVFAGSGRFDKDLWNETARDYPVHRNAIVDDLMKNHLREGMTHGEVIELLGDSVGMWYFRYVDTQGDSKRKMIYDKMIYRDYETLPPDEGFCMAYDAPSFRGEEIYPPTSKVLIIEFTAGRTVGDFYLQEWQLIDQILKFEINKTVFNQTTAQITTTADTLRAYELYNKALEHNLQLRNAEALPLYDSAIMILPNDPDFYTNRGYTRYELRDTLGAIADYERILEIDSLHATALENLGTIYSDKGKFTLALEYTLKAVQVVNAKNTYFNLGFYRYMLSDYQGAIDDFSTYLSGQYLYSATYAHYLIGNSYAFLGDMRNARRYWEKVDELGGTGEKERLDREDRKPFK